MALVLDLLRRVLEYFGWPPDQAVFLEAPTFSSGISRTIGTCLPSAISSGRCFQQLYAVIRKYRVKVVSVCQKKQHGSTRSVVRRLGTILSLEPCPRPYFKHVQDVNPVHNEEQCTASTPVAPSLADVLWVANDEGQAFTRFRTELWRKEKNTGSCDMHSSIDSIQSVPKYSTQKDGHVDLAVLQKISLLEDELTFLRAQIAAIVSAQTLGSIPSQAFKTFSTPDGFYPVPAMTSTSLSASHNHFVIPSPPPLPSVAPSGVGSSQSAAELVKQRCAERHHSATASDNAAQQRTENIPKMMDVLKDLNKVQLRAIERSPGGTPHSRPKKRKSSDWDPVTLLTHALKQKFSHRNYEEDDSLDKENQSFDSSPFSSPEISLVRCDSECCYKAHEKYRFCCECESVVDESDQTKVGHCSLKPNAKSSPIRTDEVKQAPTWKMRAHI